MFLGVLLLGFLNSSNTRCRILCTGIDSPFWLFYQTISQAIYKKYVNNSRNQTDCIILQKAVSEVSKLVDDAKNNYYMLANKLSNTSTSSKIYWSIQTTFCKNKKTPLIPPIFIGNKSEGNFKLKANHFSKYFTSKCRSFNP